MVTKIMYANRRQILTDLTKCLRDNSSIHNREAITSQIMGKILSRGPLLPTVLWKSVQYELNCLSQGRSLWDHTDCTRMSFSGGDRRESVQDGKEPEPLPLEDCEQLSLVFQGDLAASTTRAWLFHSVITEVRKLLATLLNKVKRLPWEAYS